MITDLQMKLGAEAAFYQAKKSYAEGGVPVGSALIINLCVVSLGHNQRYQGMSNIIHGETDCIEKAGHNCEFDKSIIFTTLSPCMMCAGAITLFRIPTVVILDTENAMDFPDSAPFLREAGVDVIVEPYQPAIDLMTKYRTENMKRWLADVGK